MKTLIHLKFIMLAILLVNFFSSCNDENSIDYSNWHYYNGTSDALKYSSLHEIDTTNVTSLKPIWTYNSGDADTAARSQIQTNPIVMNGILYGITPQ